MENNDMENIIEDMLHYDKYREVVDMFIDKIEQLENENNELKNQNNIHTKTNDFLEKVHKNRRRLMYGP